VKAVSTFRGRDPRECTLIAFGGNGALMAPQIADELGIRTIVVPPLPGLFSACGLIVAPNERELVHSLFGRLSGVSQATIREVLERLADRARRELVEDGSLPEAIETEYSADLRYAGQAYELTVGVAARHLDGDLVAVLATAFHDEHERTFGHSSPQDPVDLVNLRVIAHEASPLADLPTFDYADTGQSPGVTRDVFFGSEAGVRPTPIISRSQLHRRGESPGPLIIEEYDATAVVPPGWRARLDDAARLVLTRQS
jgi:N-methylhydantoinase A